MTRNPVLHTFGTEPSREEKDMLKFWSYWMAATVLGFIGGFAGGYLTIGLITGDEGPEAFGVPFEVAFPILLGLAAALMATLQWLVIRRRQPSLARWIPATALGVLFGIAVLMVLETAMGEPETITELILTGALHGVAVGAVVGSAQWLVIRDFDPSRRWIKVQLLAVPTAAVVGDIVGFSGDGGTGTMVIFVLWQALVAPTLYRITTRQASSETAREEQKQQESGMGKTGTVAMAVAAMLLTALVGVAAASTPSAASGTITQTGIVAFDLRTAGPNVIIEQTVVGTIDGTLSGTFEDTLRVVIHPNGDFTAQGSGSCSCTVDGMSGVVEYVVSDTGEVVDGVPTFAGRQVITGTSGDLAGLSGVLQIEGTVNEMTNLSVIAYSGGIHTRP
jgi:hypothetical protein